MQTSLVNPLGVYDSSTALWLQGKGQQERTVQEKQDIQSVALLTGRTEEFNRQLREQPADTELWMKFIRYQVTIYSIIPLYSASFNISFELR